MAEFNEKENAQLSDEVLESVTGGENGNIYANARRCMVTGYYWETTYGQPPAYDLLRNQSDVFVEYVGGALGRCKYRLIRYGQYMGWTTANEFYTL